ncbi:MAG: hypothetical protein QM731_02760 [Chitinophagaceae bacterium]
MSILFLILIILGGGVLLLLLLALFIPQSYSVTVSEVINKPKYIAYQYVSLFQNQIQYSEWLKADPDLRPEVVGADGAVGAVLKWESYNEDKNKNVGAGEQEIVRMDANNIEVELRLQKPMAATCRLINNIIEQGSNQTLYTCTFYAYAKFPVNLPSYLFGRRFIRKAQQKTLNNIRSIIERLE